jgi:hypothetical protein
LTSLGKWKLVIAREASFEPGEIVPCVRRANHPKRAMPGGVGAPIVGPVDGYRKETNK